MKCPLLIPGPSSFTRKMSVKNLLRNCKSVRKAVDGTGTGQEKMEEEEE